MVPLELCLGWTDYKTHLILGMKVSMISKAHAKLPGRPNLHQEQEGIFILFIAHFIVINIVSFCEDRDPSESFFKKKQQGSLTL